MRQGDVQVWRGNPAGNFDADKGLESGLSVPNFQYFRSHSSPVCHYCSIIHLSHFAIWLQKGTIWLSFFSQCVALFLLEDTLCSFFI